MCAPLYTAIAVEERVPFKRFSGSGIFNVVPMKDFRETAIKIGF